MVWFLQVFVWFLLCWSGLGDERKKSIFCWVRERSLFFNPIFNGNSDHRRFVVMVDFYFLQPQIRFSVSIFISSCYFQLKIRFKKKKLTKFLFELNDKYEKLFLQFAAMGCGCGFRFWLFICFVSYRKDSPRKIRNVYLFVIRCCLLIVFSVSFCLSRSSR